MALMGLVRVSTKGQDVARKHEILEPISVKVFEEHVSSKLKVDDRPGLTVALDYLRDGGMLTVQEVDRLGRNLVEGLVVRNDFVQAWDRSQGHGRHRCGAAHRAVLRPRHGISTCRRPSKGNSRKTRRDRGESVREIAVAVGVSAGSVWNSLNQAWHASCPLSRVDPRWLREHTPTPGGAHAVGGRCGVATSLRVAARPGQTPSTCPLGS